MQRGLNSGYEIGRIEWLNQLLNWLSCLVFKRVRDFDGATYWMHVFFTPIDPQSFIDGGEDVSH